MKMYLPYLKWKGTNIIGIPRYIGIHTKFDNNKLITLGNQITISDECILLTHDYSITNVLRAKNISIKNDIAIIKGITIGDNSFIGKRSILMPGCNIGKNCIIGAGSVVRGNIPTNSVVVGNPAKVIKTIDELSEKWQNINNMNLREDKF